MSKNLPDKKTILDQLNWRYATKKFDPEKKVSDEDWEILEQALILAPSSFGLQPFKFLVVTDPEMKEKLRPAAWGQAQITDSSHLVVVTARKDMAENHVAEFIDRIVEVRGTPREMLADYENMIEGFRKKAVAGGWIGPWSQRQAYIALGFLLETAALLGIDACPMEGFEPDQFDQILGLKDYTATALCAIGYRDADGDWLEPLPKVRFSKEKLIERI
ncbi:MAG: NAD(P)H-dependent oxidoreductase [Pyrinomonadaceae bacterium]